MTDRVRVRGNATSEEVAAVLAVLVRAEATGPTGSPAPLDPYTRWRSGRLAALRRDSR
jgi:hypothetical protein